MAVAVRKAHFVDRRMRVALCLPCFFPSQMVQSHSIAFLRFEPCFKNDSSGIQGSSDRMCLVLSSWPNKGSGFGIRIPGIGCNCKSD